MLDAFARDYLNKNAPRLPLFPSFLIRHFHLISFRRMVVLEPLKVTIENFPSEKLLIDVPNFPNKIESGGTHKVIFSKIIYIEKTDFMEVGCLQKEKETCS